MKISWTSLKISIAGARLSHLAQKDKIWDHGSMVEQAKILFYLVQKAKRSGDMESLKRQCSASCFEKLKREMNNENEREQTVDYVIKELAVLEVQPGKKNTPDMFTAVIKTNFKNDVLNGINGRISIAYWFFVRQGDWWLLNSIK